MKRPGIRWLTVLAVMTLSLGSSALAQRVNVLCSPDLAWCEALGSAFNEATGMDLEFIRVSSQDALARIRAEASNPIFDVWFGGTGDPHAVAANESLTEFYQPSVWEDLLPELREEVADLYIPLYAGALGFVVNEQVLEEQNLEVPTSWRDLADPQYAGLIAMPDPSSSGTAYTIIATLVQIFGEDEAFELLAEIHQNVSQYTSSGSAPGQLAGRGEVAIAIQFMHDGVKFVEQGFPLLVLAPEEGTGYEIGGISLIANAPNRDAGIAFIEWALTPEAQMVAAEQGDSYQVQTNVNTPASPLAPDLDSINLIDYDFERFGSPEVRDALVARWTSEISTIPR